MSKEQNSGLFPLPEDGLPVHDYGGMYDNGDFGHEYPFVIANSTPDSTPKSTVTPREQAAEAIDVAAAMYGRRAMGEGAVKAVANRDQDFLGRYGEDSERVAHGANRNGTYTQAEEAAILEPILGLIERKPGECDADYEARQLVAKISLRHTIGIEVGSPKRTKNKKRIKKIINPDN